MLNTNPTNDFQITPEIGRYITTFKYQNIGQQILAGGITTSGIVFKDGDLPNGVQLAASIGGAPVAVQLDVKTSYADGSVKMAVLSIARPDIAIGGSVEALFSLAPDGTPIPPPLDINTAMLGHSFNVDITTADVTNHIDVLAALHQALANGTASFWQSGPLASQARVEIELTGSQRLVFDVTFFSNNAFEVQAQFNNDQVMDATGGRIVYSVAVTMDGRSVALENISQGQYENWHQTFSSDASGGQATGGDLAHKGLNITRDMEYLEATGAIAQYDQSVGAAASLLNAYATATTAPGWEAPLNPNGIAQFMPGTGGRSDIGFTTEANTAWLITQNIQAANYALDQASAAGAVPWNMWDAAHKSWLSIDDYPLLWTDPRGGIGTPGNPNSTGLTQQSDGLSGWTLDSAHQPDLSYVPYVLTGQRWILDNLQAQAAWNVVNQWDSTRGDGHDLVVRDNQVRGAAWALRQIDEAAWASPDGSAAQAYFTKVENDNWAWLVAQIPVWTAQQGEAHGWLPGVYGIDVALPPWQQDYFASTAIAAARQGNADALTFLKWEANFLVGRFTHADQGFAAHDGAAYLIATSDPNTGLPFSTWAQIGAETVARGWSNGTGWAQSEGNYAQLALATLAGIAEVTGSAEAATAYRALLADKPPFTTPADFNRYPTYAIEGPGSAPTSPPASSDEKTAPIIGGTEAAGGAPTPEPVGDTLRLTLSEDAWRGHAHYSVTLDGQALVTDGVASASRAAGEHELVGLNPNLSAGPHRLVISFSNDAWGGTAATDRNLFVEAVAVNGVDLGLQAALLSNGDASFNFSIAPGAAPAVLPAMDTPQSGISADNRQGDSHCLVSIDGKPAGGERSTPARHADGLFDCVEVTAAHQTGPQTWDARFIHESSGSAVQCGRKQYVETLWLNDTNLPAPATFLPSGDAIFVI
jgi:hypothetical protein